MAKTFSLWNHHTILFDEGDMTIYLSGGEVGSCFSLGQDGAVLVTAHKRQIQILVNQTFSNSS